MKTLRFLGISVLVILLSVCFSACSKDDDAPAEQSGLAGTTWKVLSITPCEEVEDEKLVGNTISFQKDGSATVTSFRTAAYKYNDNTLELCVGGSKLDDCLYGTIVFTGNKATYTYHWQDHYGKWSGNDQNVMILEKIK